MKLVNCRISSRFPEKTVDFYRETLGFQTTRSESGNPVILAGHSRLEFYPAESGATPLYHFAFNIPENKVPEAATWLRDRVSLLSYEGEEIIFFEHWNAHSVFFRDPDGNYAEFIGRHELKNPVSESFHPGMIQSLSEMGLPVPDVDRAAAEIQRISGIEPYSAAPGRFYALGDEEGLLITVPVGRKWFPTPTPSFPHPCEIEISAAQQGEWHHPDASVSIKFV